uniref:Ashwin n=1 Tax=Ascaris lumbricoides TaxID=6252 RepID=A0A0M3HSS2_ASCLU
MNGSQGPSTLLFPELLSREELLSLLKAKFTKIGAHKLKVDRFSDDELLDYARKFLMPRSQRPEVRESQSASSAGAEKSKGKRVFTNGHAPPTTHYRRSDNDSRKQSTFDGGGQESLKRTLDCTPEAVELPKRPRKHSPIRFP